MAEATALHEPRDGWTVLYWDAERGRWEIGLGLYTDRAEAERQRDLYRHELGYRRVRLVHTADG